MSSKGMSLKGRINHYAKKNGIPLQHRDQKSISNGIMNIYILDSEGREEKQ